MRRSEVARKRTAYHEAGHAIVALHTPGASPIHKATIMPRGHALGMVSQVCVYVCVRICVCVGVCEWVYNCNLAFVCMCVRVCIYVCVHTLVALHVCVCVCVCTLAAMHVC